MDELARLADDGCPNCGGPARLTYPQMVAAVAAHEGMVWVLAAFWKKRNPRCELAELAAVVRGGLWEAATRFDPARGKAFSTYAVWYVRSWMKFFIRSEASHGIHTPWHLGTVAVAVAGLDGLRHLLPAPEPDDEPEDDPRFWERAESVLNEQQARVLEMRFRGGLKLRECGELLGVTRERVRQIEAKALEALRAAGFGCEG